MSRITIKKGPQKRYAYSALIEKLVDWDYYRVPMVIEPGEFAVRGSIIDVFSVHHTHPIRIEYFGEDIDRLASFDISTQKSLSALDKTTLHEIDKDTIAPVLKSEYEGAGMAVLSDIKEGDYVVHEDYGIGLFQSLCHLVIGQREGEYATIQYKGKDKLYVPLEQLHRLHKYSGGEIVPKVNGLHDASWNRTKMRTKRALQELASSIYETVKKRQLQQGFACEADTENQILMEKAFPHPLTPDQDTTLQAIKADMCQTKPMDRLICGDVGFGKTELLVCAAFKAIENLKQVAVLAPTTILAEQHFRTFSKRFEPFGYKVASLSRMQSKETQKQLLKGLKNEEVHCVIGTHRLLQKDVEFGDLGLLIIDEEQRFGVTHKERIKQLKVNVDILSTSATPIPRTLYMALTGAKDFSHLQTPPISRKPIHTEVAEFCEQTVKSAIESELKRGGQVYYLFNSVAHIHEKAAALQALLPESRIAILHGKMSAKQIEASLGEFYQGKQDVLLSTTIIENGLDIPAVNTIIMDKAESLGLSQIHQIRGRVGRGSTQAYAYVFYSPDKGITEKAKKRLLAIKEYVALGAGYHLALKDLEIRGAGTLLGEKQHGHMTAVGFELYCKLLEESVQIAKGESVDQRAEIILNPTLKAYIPESYVISSRERLALYKRMMSLPDKDAMDELSEELRDRYGSPPAEVTLLIEAVRYQLP